MEPRFVIRLFGRLSVRCGDQELFSHTPLKAKELFAYLAVHRRRPHARESIATLLWPECPSEQSRKNLRQALWQLNSALRHGPSRCVDHVLIRETNHLEFHHDQQVWIDVEEFEAAFKARSPRRPVSDSDDVTRFAQAVQLYQGDLLEGFYAEWCLRERDRLKQIYFTMMDALIANCESIKEYETGLEHAAAVLRSDGSRECTHRAMMRLFYLSGDRVAALRQYKRCEDALREELGVGPDEETRALRDRIASGRPVDPGGNGGEFKNRDCA